MFAAILIIAGAVGLVLDRRESLPEAGYGWVPGASVACLLIGGLLLLGRLSRDGGHGLGIAITLCGTAALVTDRVFHWVPSPAQSAVPVVSWILIVLGVLVWIGGMASRNGLGGLTTALAFTAVASVVADSAFELAAPWDATLNVTTTALAAGAFAAGLAGMGSMLSDDDILGSVYTWLGSAVALGLGVAVTAMVAAGAFDEPRWVFALLVVLVVAGAGGAGASVFLGARAISRNRLTYAKIEAMAAEERAHRYWYDDEDDPEPPARESSPPPAAATAAAAERRSPWHSATFLMGVTADTIAIVSVIVLAIDNLGD
jgi:hypothetical protein